MSATDGEVFETTQTAVVIILQSQLHGVEDRRALGDLTKRPWSSVVWDLAINIVLLAAKREGSPPPSTISSYAWKFLRTNTASTYADTVWETIGTQCRFLLVDRI